MIVPMVKVYLVARSRRPRPPAGGPPRAWASIHLVPVDPAQALADEQTRRADPGALQRALQVLSGDRPQGDRARPCRGRGRPGGARYRAAVCGATATAWPRCTTNWNSLTCGATSGWSTIEELRQAGIEVGFYAVPADAPSSDRRRVRGRGRRAARRTERWWPRRSAAATSELPEWAVPMPLPPRDAPSIRAEAAQIDAALKAGCTGGCPSWRTWRRQMHAEFVRLQEQAELHRWRNAAASTQRPAVRRPRLAACRKGVDAGRASSARPDIPAAVAD